MSSLSNLVFIILIAQISSSVAFAGISTIWTVVSFSIVISRVVIGVPLLLDVKQSSDGDNLFVSGARSGALFLGVPVFLASIGMFVFADRDIGMSFLLLAACTPLILLQDFGRYLAIASGRSRDALVSDLVLLTPLLLTSILSVSKLITIEANTALGILFVGLSFSLLPLRRYNPIDISIKNFRTLVSSDVARRKKLLQEALLNAFTAIASVAAVWLAYDSNSVAAFNGVLYALAPISFAAIVVNLVIQQSISMSMGSIHKREYCVLASLLIASFLWSVLVVQLPINMGVALFGVTWDLIQPLVIPMTVVLCLSLVMEFVLVVFRARAQFSTIVTVRTLSSISIPIIYVAVSASGYQLATALCVVAGTHLLIVIGLYARSRPCFLNQFSKTH